MGTTVSMMLVADRNAFIAHVGDSRIYLIRQGQIHQLTEDHSLLREQLRRGLITEEEAKRSPHQSVITRAVGAHLYVDIDKLFFEILPEDQYVLCTDGLYEYFSDDELREIFEQNYGDSALEKAVEVANSRGGRDNITAVLIKIEEKPDVQWASEVKLRIDTLRQVFIFRNLSYKELAKVLNITSIRIYNEGDTIVREGELGDEFYVILSGSVKVCKGQKELNRLDQGMHFGEMALIDRQVRSASVIAVRRTIVLCIDRVEFYNLIRDDPKLAVKILWTFTQHLSLRLRQANLEMSG
jgi:hypothetical protein